MKLIQKLKEGAPISDSAFINYRNHQRYDFFYVRMTVRHVKIIIRIGKKYLVIPWITLKTFSYGGKMPQ